jgi:hypothetical protein
MKVQRDVVEASGKEDDGLASLTGNGCLEIFVIQAFPQSVIGDEKCRD